jgi:hypothetical protein
MVIIWGSGLYGKVDEVPQLCHVATRFGHLYYIPLIPLGSYAVFDKSGDQFSGAPIPLSGKSVVMAWLRAACVVGAAVSGVAAIINFAGHQVPMAAALLILAMMLVTLFAATKKAKFFTQASYERAVRLSERVGLTPEARLMIEIIYGRMTADEASQQLEQYEQQQPQPALAATVID